MNEINAVLTRVTEALLAPFVSMPLVGLLFWSAVAGVVMTYVFGKTSSQRGLKQAADRTRAQLLAVRLFKDDLTVTFRCQVELMKATARRLLYSIPPMLVMIVPFVVVLCQLAVYFEHRPLRPNETTVVSLLLADDEWERYRDVVLEHPPAVELEIPQSMRSEDDHGLYWRIRPVGRSTEPLRWRFGDCVIEKRLAVAENVGRLQPVSVHRPGTGLFDRLLHPVESGFTGDSPVYGITVRHPTRSTPVFGIPVPWWATFLIVSILAALVARRFMAVQF